MSSMHFPWLEASILLPLLGALLVANVRSLTRVRYFSIAICSMALLLAIGEWIDFASVGTFRAQDGWDVVNWMFHRETFVVDELSAPLLPLTALIYFVTVLSTARTEQDRSWYVATLIGEAILLCIFSMQASWGLVAMLSLSVLPAGREIRRRGHSPRVYFAHMGLFVALLVVGYGIASANLGPFATIVGASLLTAAALVRSGIMPLHCWISDLFEKVSLGTALLNVVPLIGAFAVMRLVLPIAPSWGLHTIAVASTITAVYAAGMASVQREARRFFCYLFLSNASLVLVGLELVTPIGLAGALCVWLSIGLSLTGFALVLRAVEARIGRISLDDYHGLYRQMPGLAGFFVLTGLASIGFPGTIGFIAMEMLVEGAVAVSPFVGCAVVLASAINGITVLSVYMRIFTGKTPSTTLRLRTRAQERVAVLLLTLLIVGGGILPQAGVHSRYHAARELLRLRPQPTPAAVEASPPADSTQPSELVFQPHGDRP